MSFLSPTLLWLLGIVPLLVVGYVALRRRTARQNADLGTMGFARTRSGRPLGRRRHIPYVMFLLGITVLLVALARPQVNLHLPHREGTVVLAFDVSNSMIADDLAPSRLTAAKRAARGFVEDQPGSVKVGVVAFSGAAFVVQPPTNVKGEVLGAIRRLSPEGGTSLGQGILASLNAIAGKPISLDLQALSDGGSANIGFLGSSAVVLLTDGEDTSNLDPIAVTDAAAQAGVRIYPIGIGSEAGAVVEVDGFNIATRLDEALLREVAEVGNGKYFRARDATELAAIYRDIDLHLTTRGEDTEVTGILAAAGALILLLGAGLTMMWFGRVP
jgi:Ca-activated chloride channel family protein